MNPRLICHRCALIAVAVWLAVVAAPASNAGTGTLSGADCPGEVDQWIESHGHERGYSEDRDTLIVVGSASVDVPREDPTYLVKRIAAFEFAMASARKSGADFLNAAISTRNEARMIAGDMDLGKAAHQLCQRQVKGATEVVSSALLTGLAAWNTFECFHESGSVVYVVAALSPSYVSAVRGDAPSGERGSSPTEWFSSLSDDEVLFTFGSRILPDGNQKLLTVAFGHQQVSAAGGGLAVDAAFDGAKKDAEGKLATVRAGQVATRALRESLSTQVELDRLPPRFSSATAFDQLVRDEAKVKLIKGPVEIGRRQIKVGSYDVAVVACALMMPEQQSHPRDTGRNAVQQAAGECPPVDGPIAKSIRPVRASGFGKDRQLALTAALLDAIKQQGVDVKGDSLLQRRFEQAMESVGGEVREKVKGSTKQQQNVQTFANGFIHSYAVLSEVDQGEQVRIDICANLVEFDPANPRFGLPPTLAVLPFLCPEKGVLVGGAQEPCSSVTSIAEQAFEAGCATSRKLVMIDDRNQPKLVQVRADIRRRVQDGGAEEVEAIKLGKQLTADFVLVGKVTKAEFNGPPGARPQKVPPGAQAVASVEARLVNVSNNEVIWAGSKLKILTVGDLAQARRPGNPELGLSPVELAVHRAVDELLQSLRVRLDEFHVGNQKVDAVVPAQPAASLTILRVARGTVTLDSSDPRIRPGARFIVNSLVEIKLPNGKVEVDRDRVAVIEVTSVTGGLAKASVIDGDADLITATNCEVVPYPDAAK